MLRSDLLQLYGNSGNSREQETLLRIDINREDVFESSYRQILNIPTKYLRRRFLIRFKGEEGIDYGGVTREWLYLLSHSMLDPTYGLFEYCNEEIYTLEINPNSGINPEHLSYFTFIGKIIGIAIFHGHYLDGGFTLPFYKKILSIRLTLDDLESVDPELWNSLKWILNNDITDSGLDEQYFVVNYDSFGLTKEESLCPSGDQIKLNEENKKNYVEKYISWRFNKGTKEQFKALLAGLNAIVPIEFLKKQFDEKELELVITGLGKIDVLDWKSNSKYRNLTFDSELVVWWWEIVTEFADLERARLLQFATGSSRVPIAGFSALRGATNKDMNTIKLFTLVLVEVDSDSLPKAHTCFNRIDIPLYESKSKFKQKLMQAINETIGFHVD
jgi:E3 ubiquitin ligase SMURF1/2